MNNSSKIIKSHTFVGTSPAYSLIVVPDWSSSGVHEREYEKDAEQILDWLHSTFCDRTLKELRERLPQK